MPTLLRAGLLVALLTYAVSADLQAQDLHPSRRPSPAGIAKTHIGNAYVKVVYGRPYVRNRGIFGTNTDSTTYLVPFGELWRTGANEATEITLTESLLVNGSRLDAGTYSIFTEPGATEWVIHFSPQLGLDGTGIFNAETQEFTPNVYDPSQDVLVIRVPSGTLDDVVDQFTISFEQADGATHMVFRWERTEVRVPFGPAS
ncbi:MAG: DUF2911 domain-containing protein [Rhodothermales bacterium]